MNKVRAFVLLSLFVLLETLDAKPQYGQQSTTVSRTTTQNGYGYGGGMTRQQTTYTQQGTMGGSQSTYSQTSYSGGYGKK